MLLIIDNYDSFTYNLVQYFGQLGAETAVYRNDEISMEEIGAMKPAAIVISPGPCSPKEAGISVDIVKRFYEQTPILGVCLGHQSIGYAFGGDVVRAGRLMHGKVSPILNDGKTIFKGLANPFPAGRYHSLLVDRGTLPECLEVSAETAEGEIMGLRHREYPVEGNPVPPGVDPHPEREKDPEKFFEDDLKKVCTAI